MLIHVGPLTISDCVLIIAGSGRAPGREPGTVGCAVVDSLANKAIDGAIDSLANRSTDSAVDSLVDRSTDSATDDQS